MQTLSLAKQKEHPTSQDPAFWIPFERGVMGTATSSGRGRMTALTIRALPYNSSVSASTRSSARRSGCFLTRWPLRKTGNQSMRPQKPQRRACFWALCRKATVLRSLLPGQVAATHGLESHDDISDLQVPFLLQVCQDPRPEEDFALPDSVQVGVEFQGFDLQKKGGQVLSFSAVTCVHGACFRKVPPQQAPGSVPSDWGGGHLQSDPWGGAGAGAGTHHENAGLLPIHEAFGNGVGSQDLVAGDTGQKLLMKRLSASFQPSTWPGSPPPTALPAPQPPPQPQQAHRWRNSWKTILLGKPWRQMRMPSSTPLQRSCSSTRKASSLPDCKGREAEQWTRGLGLREQKALNLRPG